MNYSIKINDEIETLGLITYNIRVEGDEFFKDGALKTHVYIEEIHTLECDRFRLNGVNVYAEASGSNDIFYMYAFTYDSVEILDGGADYKLEELLEMYKKEGE